MGPSLAAFVPVAALLIVAPGPDVLLVIHNATLGRTAGLATAAGTVTGLLVHATAATVGLSALVTASAEAFTVVKVVGAAYLVLLGAQALRSGRRTSAAQQRHHPTAGQVIRPTLRPRVALRQGVLTNVLNPKVAVFFMAFLPQFIPVGSSPVAGTAALAGMFVTMTAGYLLLLVALTVRAAALLTRPTVRLGSTELPAWSSSASASVWPPPTGRRRTAPATRRRSARAGGDGSHHAGCHSAQSVARLSRGERVPPVFDVRLLGEQRVAAGPAAGGRSPSPRLTELLAYLVLHAGIPQTRQHLAGSSGRTPPKRRRVRTCAASCTTCGC